MRHRPKWQRDETTHPGVDFADGAEVDAHVRMIEDDPAHFDSIIKRLDLQSRHTLIDVGAGAGGFAIRAARQCKQVYAVDVSEAMLNVARKKAREAGTGNISFVQGGFLTYEHAGPPVDVIVSHTALHHLPDTWKLIGLTRLAEMTKDGGRLHLMDVVHTFDPSDYAEAFNAFVRGAAEHFGREMIPKAEATIRQEFPTWDWIIEGMLRRAGFRIDLADYRGGLAEYLCTKCPAGKRSIKNCSEQEQSGNG